MVKLKCLKYFNLLVVLLFVASTICCSKSDNIPGDSDNKENITEFAKGADVSWVTEMEKAGRKFYNSAGAEMECMELLKSLGMNSIRLRVWVNPANGWCNKQDLLAKAIRANNLGMRLMIDFHYSDSWADPGKQYKPNAWKNYTFEQLKSAVAEHTTDVLLGLKTKGITPEWVQVGNETNNGMLWNDGMASENMMQYAQLTTAGYDAAKAVFPNTKVIVHLSNGWNNSLYRWIFDGLKNNGGKWDVIGMSLYPEWYSDAGNWAAMNNSYIANVNDMTSRYACEVMVCEVGMSANQPTAAKSFLTDLINKSKAINSDKFLGIFYWEPQSYDWYGYGLGAFDSSGKPTVALDAFK